jgi:hypothetical protein
MESPNTGAWFFHDGEAIDPRPPGARAGLHGTHGLQPVGGPDYQAASASLDTADWC